MKRIDPTHFIDVYKAAFCDACTNESVLPINRLEKVLNYTSKSILKTVAIFYIQPSPLSLKERMERRRKVKEKRDKMYREFAYNQTQLKSSSRHLKN